MDTPEKIREIEDAAALMEEKKRGSKYLI